MTVHFPLPEYTEGQTVEVEVEGQWRKGVVESVYRRTGEVFVRLDDGPGRFMVAGSRRLR